jgi:hypothetical protein
MTHIYFWSPPGIVLKTQSLAVTTVPRAGEEINLKNAEGRYKTFTVEKVTWYPVDYPSYEGLEAEIDLSLVKRVGVNPPYPRAVYRLAFTKGKQYSYFSSSKPTSPLRR